MSSLIVLDMWGFTGLSFVLICISVVEVTVVIIYFTLCSENYHWYGCLEVANLIQVLAIFRGGCFLKLVHLRLFNVVHALSVEYHWFPSYGCFPLLLHIGVLCSRHDLWNVGIFGCLYFCLEYLWITEGRLNS
jgi:Endomembrane protein 70